MSRNLQAIALNSVFFTIIADFIILSSTEGSGIQLNQSLSGEPTVIGSALKERNVKFADIHTTPLFVKVGEFFRINATVINELPTDIIFTGNFCGYSSLSAEFDENVIVDQLSNVPRCTAMEDITLKPGQNASISGPDITVSYLAFSSGNTNTKVTFSYWVHENQQLISKNVSQSFEFNIYS